MKAFFSWPVSDRRIPVAAAMAGLLFVVLAFYPGFMSTDSFTQQAQARTGYLSDAHPPLMVGFWAVAEFFVVGPFAMLLGQVFLIASGLYFVMGHLVRHPGRRGALILFAMVFPPTASILGVIWKDIWMAGFLLWAVHLSLLTWRDLAWRRAAGALLFMGLAVGMRHNGIAAVLPMAALVAVAVARHRGVRDKARLAASAVAGGLALVVFLFVTVSAATAPFVDEERGFWQVLADYDIAGVSVRTDQLLFPDGRLRPDADLDDVESVYTSRSLLPLYKPMCEEDVPECEPLITQQLSKEALRPLREQWFSTIAAHPTEYIAHRTAVFSEVIGLDDEHVWVAYYPSRFARDAEFVVPASSFSASYGAIALALSETPLYMVWVYLLALLATLVLAVVWSRRGAVRALPHAVLAASGLFYAASYFPLAPSPDYRYSHWPVLCAVLVVATIAGARKNRLVAS
jgi:hypothetical protein